MFSITKLSLLPIAKRHKKRSLENTPEWTQMREKIDKGLKPYEAAVAIFPPADLKKLNVVTVDKIFLTMAEEYIKSRSLKLDAWKYKAEDDSLVIVVADRGALNAGTTAAPAHVNAKEPLTYPRKPGRPRKVA
jgi:hypothetical protein